MNRLIYWSFFIPGNDGRIAINASPYPTGSVKLSRLNEYSLFFFFFCLYVSIKYKWWKKLDKNSSVEKHLWKENLPPSSRSILMTSPEISVWKKKREQNKGQWGKKTAWSGELPGNSHGLGSLQNSPEVKSHLNWDSISSNVTWSQFTRTGQVILWTGNHHWE
jgi:hypothetical protein